MRGNHTNTVLLSTAVLALSFVSTVFLYPALSQTFFEPGGAFPTANTNTPINVGPVAQVKQGSLTLQNQLDLSGNRGANAKNPINPQDVATKAYVDAAAASAGIGLARGAVYLEMNDSAAAQQFGYRQFVPADGNNMWFLGKEATGFQYCHVVRFNESLERIGPVVQLGTNEFCDPIDSDAAGNVYAMTRTGANGTHELVKVTPSGTATTILGPQLGSYAYIIGRSDGIAVDDAGFVYTLRNDTTGSFPFDAVLEKWDGSGTLVGSHIVPGETFLQNLGFVSTVGLDVSGDGSRVIIYGGNTSGTDIAELIMLRDTGGGTYTEHWPAKQQISMANGSFRGVGADISDTSGHVYGFVTSDGVAPLIPGSPFASYALKLDKDTGAELEKELYNGAGFMHMHIDDSNTSETFLASGGLLAGSSRVYSLTRFDQNADVLWNRGPDAALSGGSTIPELSSLTGFGVRRDGTPVMKWGGPPPGNVVHITLHAP